VSRQEKLATARRSLAAAELALGPETRRQVQEAREAVAAHTGYQLRLDPVAHVILAVEQLAIVLEQLDAEARAEGRA
jgi:hypothetical protein